MNYIEEDIMNFELFEQDELLALIKNDMKNQQYANALEKTKYLLTSETIPVDTFAIAGKLYATLELFEKAKFFFSEYVRHIPHAFTELFQLGMVEKDLGNPEEALEIWKKVLEINSDYSEGLYYSADLNIQLHRYEDARSLLLQLLENAADNDPYIPMADQLLNRIKAH